MTILKDLEQGKISSDNAKHQVLHLFNISSSCTDDDLEEMKHIAHEKVTSNDCYTLLGKCLCALGFHNFKYYKEEAKCTGLPHIDKLDVPVRECKRCGTREHHLMSRCNGNADNWRPYLHKQEQVLHFKEM